MVVSSPLKVIDDWVVAWESVVRFLGDYFCTLNVPLLLNTEVLCSHECKNVSTLILNWDK